MNVLVTGGTGYIGRPVIAALVERAHRVRALVREASRDRRPSGAVAVIGDALDARSVAEAVQPGDTIVHLVGTPHPNPRKAGEFERVDLASIRASVHAAKERGAAHLIYVSVAHPAPVMHAYVAARIAGERAIADAALTATIVRPWYVLGPGHHWPYLLVPFYALAELIPSMREGARRLGLVRLDAMVQTLVRAVESPPAAGERRVIDVPDIRARRLP